MKIDQRPRNLRARRIGKPRYGSFVRRAPILETLERRELLAADMGSPWHNSINPRDVNHDNRVTPFDALLVINSLVTSGTHSVPVAPQTFTVGGTPNVPSLDVNGDNLVSPVDALNVINLLAGEKGVQIVTFATDLTGNAITSIPVDSDFLLQATVQDVRNPASDFPGVFSAYLNASYDSGLVTIEQPPTFNFDPFFAIARTFDASTPGLISGAGASSSSLTPPGNSVQKLWTVLIHASASGIVSFTPSFDSALGHEVLLYGLNDALAADNIDFVGSSLTITQDPTISVSAVSNPEGNSGIIPFLFTVSLSNTSNQTVTVQFNTATSGAGNAATAGVDYQSTSGTLTFTPGQTVKVVTVAVNGDLAIEPDETFNFVLSNPTNGVLDAGNIATGTIVNDDFVSTITIGDVQLTNVTAGTTNAVFTVTLSPVANSQVTVAFATSNQSATAGQDYVATSGTLTFDPNVALQTITVTIIGDPLPDTTETFLVTLSNPSGNAALLDGVAQGTIFPAVPIPNLTVNNVSLLEGNAGSITNFVFTATLSSPAPQQILVRFETLSDSATTADNDYVATIGTLTFAVGQSSQTVTVPVVGDETEEPNESFLLTFAPVSGPIGTVQSPATGTIQNDDGPPTLVISDATVEGPPSGFSDAVFTVTLSVPRAVPVTVGFATEDNTAVANEDYLAQSGILTFLPGGPLFQTIIVPVIGSAVTQDDETFLVNLSSASPPPDQGGAVIADAQALGTIVRQGLSIGDQIIVEGNSGTTNALFTVSLSHAQADIVTVAFATEDDTATVANADYLPTSGTLTFAAGETNKIVTVPIVGDVTIEPNESFFVNLSNAAGTTIFGQQAECTILNDDGQKALLQVQLADTNGVALPNGTTLDVNDDFLLQVFVQDIQPDPNGIAAAYLDVVYNSNLVVVNGAIAYGPLFGNVQSGSTSTPGLIDEAGAFGQLQPPADPGARQLLFSVPLKAIDVGLATFTPDPADDPDHEVLEYTSDIPIPPAAVNFLDTSINIGENVLAINSISQPEGTGANTSMVFTVTRFLSSAQEATVVFSTNDGSATAGQDYIATSGTLTFAMGQTTKTITVPIVADSTDEGDETFTVNLSNAIGATASQNPGLGTILDDDPLVSVSFPGVTASENENLIFTVSLSQPSGKTVTVAFTTADATSGDIATPGLDYTPTSGTLTFAPGVTRQFITVPALGDNIAEPSESFLVVLSDPVNGTISTASAVATIIDVPPASITGLVYLDTNNNGQKDASEKAIAGATVRAIRQGGVSIASATTAADGTFVITGLVPGTYTIEEVQPGFYLDGRDTRFGVDSPVNDKFTGVVLAASQVASGFQFGESGVRSEFLSIFLNRRAFFASMVVNGHSAATSAAAPMDLRLGDLWVSFDGGWDGARAYKALFSDGTCTLTLYNDALQPIAVSAPTTDGAQISYTGTAGSPYFMRISGTSSSVTLQRVETVSIGNVSLSEGDSGTTNFVFAVSLSGAKSQAVTVNYATVDGTATSASGDYTSQSGALTFAAGETLKLITVAVAGDAVNEQHETFNVVLSVPVNIALGTVAGVGTILNDDTTQLFSTTTLFAGNAGDSSGGSAAPQTSSGDDSDEVAVAQSSSAPASESMAAEPMVALDDDASAADRVLEEDEDWLLESLVA